MSALWPLLPALWLRGAAAQEDEEGIVEMCMDDERFHHLREDPAMLACTGGHTL